MMPIGRAACQRAPIGDAKGIRSGPSFGLPTSLPGSRLLRRAPAECGLLPSALTPTRKGHRASRRADGLAPMR